MDVKKHKSTLSRWELRLTIFLITLFSFLSFDSVNYNHFFPFTNSCSTSNRHTYMFYYFVSLYDVQFYSSRTFLYICYLGDMLNCTPNFRLKGPSHCITVKLCNILPRLWFTFDIPDISTCWFITYHFNSYFCKHSYLYSFLFVLIYFIHCMHWNLEGVSTVAEKTVINI